MEQRPVKMYAALLFAQAILYVSPMVIEATVNVEVDTEETLITGKDVVKHLLLDVQVMFNVQKTKFVDCRKEENLVSQLVLLCNVEQELFALQEIMLPSVHVLRDYLQEILMELDVNKSTVLKMMTVLMTSIVTGFLTPV